MEEKGVELEQRLRSTDDVEAVDDKLVEEWFTLVNQKNQLIRQVRPVFVPSLFLCLSLSLIHT